MATAKIQSDPDSWGPEFKDLVLIVLRWVGGAAGVATLFGVIGWYIQLSQDNLFGIRSELASNFATTYLLIFAQFVIDCLRLLMNWHPLTVILAVLLIVVVVSVQKRWRATLDAWLKRYPLLSAGVVLLMVAAWTTYFAMPTFLFSNALFENASPGRTFDVGFLPSAVAGQAWKEVACQRVTKGCDTRESQPSSPCKLFFIGCQGWYYSARLESRFTCALMLLGFLWWAGAIVTRSHRRLAGVPIGLRVVVLGGLLAATILVPYMYGKLILSTKFPKATIYFTKDSTEYANVASLTLNSSFLVVREYSDKFVLYDDFTKEIWPVPKSHVSAMRIGAPDDLLEKGISRGK